MLRLNSRMKETLDITSGYTTGQFEQVDRLLNKGGTNVNIPFPELDEAVEKFIADRIAENKKPVILRDETKDFSGSFVRTVYVASGEMMDIFRQEYRQTINRYYDLAEVRWITPSEAKLFMEYIQDVWSGKYGD
ncbi:hypothetical protein EEL32_00400 (plasmid) [Brevibacillus laterosporus]|nr:hypothetical protein [Brevibacillus laterosporus]TPG93549.1 hypothetical protein EEL32_00400 [Brevibacillus laterosporus]